MNKDYYQTLGVNKSASQDGQGPVDAGFKEKEYCSMFRAGTILARSATPAQIWAERLKGA